MNAQWHYRVETLGGILRGPRPQEFEILLNQAAEEGWELVILSPQTNTNRMWVVLRRPASTRPRRRAQDWP
jgi:hypothetical protein